MTCDWLGHELGTASELGWGVLSLTIRLVTAGSRDISVKDGS